MNAFIEKLSQPIVNNYINMETELMVQVADYIAKNKSIMVDNIVHWKALQLAKLGELTKQNIITISKYSGLSKHKVKGLFESVVQKGLIKDESILALASKAGALKEVVPLMKSAVTKVLGAAAKDTLTTFNKMNNSILKSTGSQYVKIINDVSTQVISGTATVDKALAQAVRAFNDEGLTAFIAKNGNRYSPETYAKMVIQANAKNAVTKSQDIRYAESGVNYVEVDAYGGARPKCAQDQGYIYSLDDNAAPIQDLDGNTIEPRGWGSTSYGEADGLLGINCGHSRWAFVPGYSTQATKHEDINRKENTKQYEERQQQRYYERNTRNAKREKAMLEKSGASKKDVQMAQAKVSRWQTKNRDFVKETNGTRYYANERIYVK